MSFNYFEVFAGADKEMMHSAMLRHILLHHPALAQKLFTAFPQKVDVVELEKPYALNKQLYRMDVEAWSTDEQHLDEQHLLVIENKFKAFPTLRQLEEYDALYQHEKKKPVCYLVCFALEGVPFQENNVVRTPNFIWNILCYREIEAGIEEYLAAGSNSGSPLAADDATLLRHYADYLHTYYLQYDAVRESYHNAFMPPANDRAGEKRVAEQKNRFWQRLALSTLGNDFTARRRTLGICTQESDASYGGSTSPLLMIFPAHWDALLQHLFQGSNKPVLAIQMQHGFFKLGLDRLPKNMPDGLQDKVAGYALTLPSTMPGSVTNTPEKTIRARLKSGARFITLCKHPVEIHAPLHKVGEQLWQFYTLMDDAVQKTKEHIQQ